LFHQDLSGKRSSLNQKTEKKGEEKRNRHETKSRNQNATKFEEKDGNLSFFLSCEIKGERKCDPKSRKLTIICPFKESKYKNFF